MFCLVTGAQQKKKITVVNMGYMDFIHMFLFEMLSRQNTHRCHPTLQPRISHHSPPADDPPLLAANYQQNKPYQHGEVPIALVLFN